MRSMPRGPLMVGIQGHQLLSEEKTLLLHPNIGGVILFTRNFSSKAQLKVLTAEIHALRSPSLLIAVDHEGGRVQRFKEEFTPLPALSSLGEYYAQSASQALRYSHHLGELMAFELKMCGVDISFAPVLDIDDGQSDIVKTRGFHAMPHIISALASAYMQGMRAANMVPVGKHFPGHGSVTLDTHLETVTDCRSYQAIHDHDLVPFVSMIDQGLEAVMSAHVVYPHVDKWPASFSSVWLKKILRQQLNFSGIVFSDDLGMAAAKAFGDALTGTQEALKAGCDMVLLCNDVDQIKAVTHDLAQQDYHALSERLAVFTTPVKHDTMAQNNTLVALKQDVDHYKARSAQGSS